MTTTRRKRCQRIVLKISGEALMGKKAHGIDTAIIENLAREVKPILKLKTQLGIVVGAGNFFRGGKLNGEELSRVTGDHLGMISTMLNALAIQDIFIRLGIPTKVMSAIPIEGIVERYDHRQASEYLDEGFVVIFSGGTGNPFVTTDTALCLRGIELNADMILKATNVDGIYDADPKNNPKAKLYSKLTYAEALKKKLAVMDLFAFSLGSDHKMKLRVFNMFKKNALSRIVKGLNEGTLVK